MNSGLNSKIKKQVTIGISCYGNKNIVQDVLSTLYKFTSEKLFHLIVRNDDPDDQDMNSLLDRYYTSKENITIINDSKNIGIVRANNQFIDFTKTKFLVFMNSDILVTKGWLTSLLSTSETFPSWDIIGCKLLYPDNTIQHAGIGYMSKRYRNEYDSDSLWDYLPYHPKRGADPNDSSLNRFRELGGVTTALAMFKTKIFNQIGKFDINYSPGMYDDPDYCLEAIKAGHKIGYTPKASAYHLEGKSFDRINKREIILKNADYFLKKWEPWLTENLRDKYKNNIWGSFPEY